MSAFHSFTFPAKSVARNVTVLMLLFAIGMEPLIAPVPDTIKSCQSDSP